MKRYKVGFYYSESGYIFINATSKSEAEKKAYKKLADDGLCGMEYLKDYETNDREYDTLSSDEL